MPMNVNQDYSQFYVGTEQLKSYGSNSAAKKDTLVKYRFNTTDEHGNKVMDKMSKEETMKAVNEISAQYGDSVIVQFSGDGLAALAEGRKFMSGREMTAEEATKRAARDTAFQAENVIQHENTHRIVIPNYETNEQLYNSLAGADDKVISSTMGIISNYLMPGDASGLSEQERQDKVAFGLEAAKYLAENYLDESHAGDFMSAMETIAKYAEEFGLTEKSGLEIPENSPHLSDTDGIRSSIGQGTNLFSVSQLARYVSAVADRGTVYNLTLLDRLTDSEGNTIEDYPVSVYNKIHMADSSWNVIQEGMHQVALNTDAFDSLNLTVAGKTGTSEYSRDLWLSAYTPYFTASVWGGYDCGKPMENIYNQVWHEVLWKNIMERVHEGLPRQEFNMPAGIQQKTICQQSGFLATSSCYPVVTEYFAENAPTVSCSGHYRAPAVEEKDDDEDDDGTTSGDDSTTGSEGSTGGTSGDTTGGTSGGSTSGGTADTPSGGTDTGGTSTE